MQQEKYIWSKFIFICIYCCNSVTGKLFTYLQVSYLLNDQDRFNMMSSIFLA